MIRINDDYFITVDTLNFTLFKDYHKKDKNGNRACKTIGYYGTLSKALKAFADVVVTESIMTDEEISLLDAAKAIREKQEEIKNLISRSFDTTEAHCKLVGASYDNENAF